MKGSTFERLVVGFVVSLSDYFNDQTVSRAETDFPVQTLMEKRLFTTFKSVRYETDVAVQFSFRPMVISRKGRCTVGVSTNFTATN